MTAEAKKIPSSYCIWCEENLASKDHFPYCSKFCKVQEARGRGGR